MIIDLIKENIKINKISNFNNYGDLKRFKKMEKKNMILYLKKSYKKLRNSLLNGSLNYNQYKRNKLFIYSVFKKNQKNISNFCFKNSNYKLNYNSSVIFNREFLKLKLKKKVLITRLYNRFVKNMERSFFEKLFFKKFLYEYVISQKNNKLRKEKKVFKFKYLKKKYKISKLDYNFFKIENLYFDDLIKKYKYIKNLEEKKSKITNFYYFFNIELIRFFSFLEYDNEKNNKIYKLKDKSKFIFFSNYINLISFNILNKFKKMFIFLNLLRRYFSMSVFFYFRKKKYKSIYKLVYKSGVNIIQYEMFNRLNLFKNIYNFEYNISIFNNKIKNFLFYNNFYKDFYYFFDKINNSEFFEDSSFYYFFNKSSFGNLFFNNFYLQEQKSIYKLKSIYKEKLYFDKNSLKSKKFIDISNNIYSLNLSKQLYFSLFLLKKTKINFNFLEIFNKKIYSRIKLKKNIKVKRKKTIKLKKKNKINILNNFILKKNNEIIVNKNNKKKIKNNNFFFKLYIYNFKKIIKYLRLKNLEKKNFKRFPKVHAYSRFKRYMHNKIKRQYNYIKISKERIIQENNLGKVNLNISNNELLKNNNKLFIINNNLNKKNHRKINIKNIEEKKNNLNYIFYELSIEKILKEKIKKLDNFIIYSLSLKKSKNNNFFNYYRYYNLYLSIRSLFNVDFDFYNVFYEFNNIKNTKFYSISNFYNNLKYIKNNISLNFFKSINKTNLNKKYYKLNLNIFFDFNYIIKKKYNIINLYLYNKNIKKDGLFLLKNMYNYDYILGLYYNFVYDINIYYKQKEKIINLNEFVSNVYLNLFIYLKKYRLKLKEFDFFELLNKFLIVNKHLFTNFYLLNLDYINLNFKNDKNNNFNIYSKYLLLKNKEFIKKLTFIYFNFYIKDFDSLIKFEKHPMYFKNINDIEFKSNFDIFEILDYYDLYLKEKRDKKLIDINRFKLNLTLLGGSLLFRFT